MFTMLNKLFLTIYQRAEPSIWGKIGSVYLRKGCPAARTDTHRHLSPSQTSCLDTRHRICPAKLNRKTLAFLPINCNHWGGGNHIEVGTELAFSVSARIGPGPERSTKEEHVCIV